MARAVSLCCESRCFPSAVAGVLDQGHVKRGGTIFGDTAQLGKAGLRKISSTAEQHDQEVLGAFAARQADGAGSLPSEGEDEHPGLPPRVVQCIARRLLTTLDAAHR
jgi:hypothetical protein